MMASGLYREYTYQCRDCGFHTDSTAQYADHINQHGAQAVERVRGILERLTTQGAAGNDANPTKEGK